MMHLLLSCLLLFFSANTPRQEIDLGYQRIANAFKSKSVEALLKENFRWRNDDGSFPSSDEVKRVWSTNLSAIKKYSAVQFEVTQVNLQKDSATVTATRTMFFVYEGSDEEQIEVVKVRDLWVRENDHWHLESHVTHTSQNSSYITSPPVPLP